MCDRLAGMIYYTASTRGLLVAKECFCSLFRSLWWSRGVGLSLSRRAPGPAPRLKPAPPRLERSTAFSFYIYLSSVKRSRKSQVVELN